MSTFLIRLSISTPKFKPTTTDVTTTNADVNTNAASDTRPYVLGYNSALSIGSRVNAKDRKGNGTSEPIHDFTAQQNKVLLNITK